MKYNYKDYIADVKDFPIEGILFRDITPLMANGEVFKQAWYYSQDKPCEYAHPPLLLRLSRY